MNGRLSIERLRAADAAERRNLARYERLRRLTLETAAAAREADVLGQLEVALRLIQP